MLSEINYALRAFYPYFWRKFKILDEDDNEIVYTKEFKNLREAVWVHIIVSFSQWRHFLESPQNLLPMIFSREAFVSTVCFMVSSTIKDMRNIHESFLTTCSLVTAVAAYIHNKGYKEFIKYCPHILEVLFEEYFSQESDKIKIRDHFRACNYSDAYAMVEQRTNGNPFADIINKLDFVMEIKEKIRSEISVQKPAAVYLCTTEVIKRYESRTSENNSVISKVNVSIQTEGSFPSLEEQREFETGRKFLTGLNELIDLKILAFQAQLLRNEVNQEVTSRTEPTLSGGRENILRNEQISASRNATRVAGRVTDSAISKAPEDVIRNTSEVVISETNPLSQQESSLEDAKQGATCRKRRKMPCRRQAPLSRYRSLKTRKNRKRVFVCNQIFSNRQIIENLSSTASSSELEEQSNSVVENSSQETDDKIEDYNSSVKEKTCQEKPKGPRTPEGEPNLSETEETKNINSMQNSSLQLQEKSLPNNMREGKSSNEGESIPVLITYNRITDDFSGLKSENLQEKSSSGVIHESKNTNQNLTSQPQKTSKKNKKSKKGKKKLETNGDILNFNNVQNVEAADFISSADSEQTLRIEKNQAETNEEEQISPNGEVGEAVSLEASIQNEENRENVDESLHVPDIKEVILALDFFNRKLKKNLRDVCSKFNVPVNFD